MKPASDSHSPGDPGKCPQGLGSDWGQGGLTGCGLISDDRPGRQIPVPFGGWRESTVAPSPAEDLTTSLFPNQPGPGAACVLGALPAAAVP